MAGKLSFLQRSLVMPTLAFGRLQELQVIDLQLDALRAEVVQLEAALADHGEIEEARRTQAVLTRAHEQASATLRDAELALATITAEVERKSKHLYSGSVVNSRELEALQADIAQLMQQRAVREERALQAMVAAEETEAARDEQQDRLDSLETTFATRQKVHGARLQELAVEIPLREEERAALAAQNEPSSGHAVRIAAGTPRRPSTRARFPGPLYPLPHCAPRHPTAPRATKSGSCLLRQLRSLALHSALNRRASLRGFARHPSVTCATEVFQSFTKRCRRRDSNPYERKAH